VEAEDNNEPKTGSRDVPTALANVPKGQGAFELEGEAKTFYDTVGGVMGFQEKDVFSVIERTHLAAEEYDIFTGLIQMANHGIGGEALDYPIPEIAEKVILELRARRSGPDMGGSSKSFENIMTAWVTWLRQREAQAAQENRKMVGG
jgi:hypothetical protein